MAKGSCLCGNLKYEFSGEPVQKVICHCLTCRKITGSTNAVCILVPSVNLTFTSESSLKRTMTVHESGMQLELFFCSDCGSSVCKEPQGEANRGAKIVFGGTLDLEDAKELDKMRSQAELWIKYRVDWLSPIEGTGQLQGFE